VTAIKRENTGYGKTESTGHFVGIIANEVVRVGPTEKRVFRVEFKEDKELDIILEHMYDKYF
jgi:hypothetical protein